MPRVIVLLVVVIAAVYIWNASWRAAPPENPSVKLIAHRGVHQTFSRENLDNDTCTAERIYPPRHEFIENTIPSMKAAFEAGADIVELDVHPTTDGKFAVIHDWTLDCRTEGSGPVRQHAMADLKKLDVGHGYTADGGKTFPLRGRGVGMMPELQEVLSAIPEGRFLVNFKSKEEREGDMLGDLVASYPEWRTAIWGAYGGDAPTLKAAERIDDLAIWTRHGLVRCLGLYIATGWTGHMPEACRDTKVMVPINVAPWLWGWPNLFQERIRRTGSEIILLGPYGAGDPSAAGIDTREDFARVPERFSGYVWTNRIELIGPLAGRAAQK